MNKTFTGGVPYAIDVKSLMEAFSIDTLTEGRVIPHDELEATIGSERGSQRYYGVVNSWIGRVKNETGVFLVWDQGTGVRVLDPASVLGHAETRTRQKIKQTGRAIKTFAWVKRERLDDTGKARLDHQMRVAMALKTAIDTTRKELAVELAPVKCLPKRNAS